MNASTNDLVTRANKTADRLRAAGKSEKANRFCGRAEVVIARHAARIGDPLPTLYVTAANGGFNLTTWPGNFVARLEVTGKARAFNCELTCYAAVIEGRRYFGRGHGPSMYLNLNPGRKVAR